MTDRPNLVFIMPDQLRPDFLDDYFHFLHARGHRKYHGNEHEGYFEQKGAIVNRLPPELQPDQWVGAEACRYIRE